MCMKNRLILTSCEHRHNKNLLQFKQRRKPRMIKTRGIYINIQWGRSYVELDYLRKKVF